MHCALLIEDIISRILDEVDVKSRWALARTCRSFTEPALDAVWATRTDAWALGGLMPKDLWTVNGFAGGVDVDEDYPAAYVLVCGRCPMGMTYVLNHAVELYTWRRRCERPRLRGPVHVPCQARARLCY
jgi:hypothetical protein